MQPGSPAVCDRETLAQTAHWWGRWDSQHCRHSAQPPWDVSGTKRRVHWQGQPWPTPSRARTAQAHQHPHKRLALRPLNHA